MESCRYDGTEPSPKGYGFCAKNIPVGVVKKGTDGANWKVGLDKKGHRHWIRCNSCKETKTIQFAEPGMEEFGCTFIVTDEMYETLLEKPVYMKNQSGNAYVFGESFPKDSYVFVGSMMNDGGHVGLVDAETRPDTFSVPFFADSWEDLLVIRKDNPSILFLGETVGGDVGANLYVHHNAKKEIDGIVIDNNYFF